MKVKILKSKNETTWYKHFVDSEFEVGEYDRNNTRLPFKISGMGWVYESDCVITELPESFCVKSCDDGIKWGKYIQWLNKNYNTDFCGRIFNSDRPYYGIINGEGYGIKIPFGTEIHIDDMIKHIEYMESQQHIKGGEQFHKESQLTVKMNKEFDLTTNEGRLAYAKKHYPIGTKYIPLSNFGYAEVNSINAEFEPRIWVSERGINNGIEVSKMGLIYHGITNKWAEIIKEETNMVTQRISREGLKEIYSVACDEWQGKLKSFGYRNPLENYIDLTYEEVNEMFFASNHKQKSILSKYLKQDDGSVYLTNIKTDSDSNSIWLGDNCLIAPRTYDEYGGKAFCLNDAYKWEIKTDDYNQLCLIPTKKK